MTEKPDAFEYDVALSFANPDRSVAEQLAQLLSQKDIRVFLDEYKANAESGNGVVDHVVNLYARKAHLCVLLISSYYPLSQWTEAERKDLTQRSLREADEYIVPVQLDNRELQGMNETPGYQDLRQTSPESIVDFLARKLRETKRPSGPPTRSHDLRSGNVPPPRGNPNG